MSDTTNMRIPESLEALLVLGGEIRTSRSDLAIQIFKEAMANPRSKPLYIIISGQKSGFNPENEGVSLSAEMKQYMVGKNIPDKYILIEEKSLDTLGNIVFCHPIIKKNGFEHIGLVTDAYHMKRANYIMQRVLGSKIKVTSYSTSNNTPKLLSARDTIYIQALKFLTRNVSNGDADGFKEYLFSKHPFYKERAPFGYRIAAKVIKFVNWTILKKR